MRTHLPEDQYLQKLGLVVYLVAVVEGLLMFDLPRFQHLLPAEFNVVKLSGMTVGGMGEFIKAHGAKSTDPKVAAYLVAGGEALIEIAPLRNAMLHSRPATDGDNGNVTRLLRWRVDKAASSEVQMISDEWLDRLARRVDDIHVELNELRPPLGYHGTGGSQDTP